MKLLLSLFFIVGLAACDQKSSTDSTRERAAAEQEGTNQVDNDNLARKAAAMELDLAKRHIFYASIEGEYEGSMKVEQETFKVKFTFARSIPPYTDSRIRQLSEIESDLINLYFHMQVVQWHPDDQATAVGCRVTGLKPNMDAGSIAVASTDCPNLYTILLSEGGSSSFSDRAVKAKNVAEKVKNLVLKDVPYLIGTVQPSSNAGKYYFSVKKLNKR